MKDPPDKYRCKKGILKNLIRDQNTLIPIKDAVLRMHRMTIFVYQFIKAYVLFRYEQDPSTLPLIDENFIVQVFHVFSFRDNRGLKTEGDNADLFAELMNFYNANLDTNQWATFTQIDLPSRTHLKQCISYASTTILTGIHNNIKVHFVKRFFGFVNSYFDERCKHFYAKCSTKKQRSSFRKLLRREIRLVKDDLINHTLTCHPKYHRHLDFLRPFLPASFVNSPTPGSYQNTIFYDVKAHPMKYLPFMIKMNRYLESIDAKLFHALPLRSDIVPKSIQIDTVLLLDLLHKSGERGFNKLHPGVKLEQRKVIAWNLYFKMDDRMFKPKTGYIFDYGIHTDGISISTRFIKKIPSPLLNDDQEIIEFPYFDDLPESTIEQLKACHLVYVDPNKGNLIYCIDDENKTFRYSKQQRIHETKRVYNQRIIQKFKDNTIFNYEIYHGKFRGSISEIETKFSANSKTCYFDKFKRFLFKKNRMNALLFHQYEKEFLRKIKLRGYIDTQRSESMLIQNIKNKYQTDHRPVVLIYGDRNIGPQMKHVISTPMVGLKRRLKKAFPIIHIDEHRTSCLDYRTEERNWNPKVIRKSGKVRRLHAVLVSKIPYNTTNVGVNTGEVLSYQNRDRNSVSNMRKITHEYLWSRQRPLNYRKQTKTPGQNLGERLTG